MRTLKFRAWDKRHNCMWQTGQEGESIGEWTFQTYFDPNTRELKAVIYIESDVGFTQMCTREEELPLMQYTGLHDNKHTAEYPDGQQIYEGDICLLDKNYGDMTYSIVFDYGCFMAQMVPYKENRCELMTIYHKLEVVGNIYEKEVT